MLSSRCPPYVRFLKELCTTKEGNYCSKKAFLASNVSSTIFNQIPVQYKDLGYLTISTLIGDQLIQKALLDLEVSVNLLLFIVYEKLD